MAKPKRKTTQEVGVHIDIKGTRPWYSGNDNLSGHDRASMVTALKVEIIDVLSKSRVKAEWDNIEIKIATDAA